MTTKDAALSAYQAEVLAQARSATWLGTLPPPALSATLSSRLCGDEVTMYLDFGDSGLADLRFQSRGCALCRASAAYLCEFGHGVTPAQLAARVASFCTDFAKGEDQELNPPPPLLALYDLKRFPTRRQCVLLPWEALRGML